MKIRPTFSPAEDSPINVSDWVFPALEDLKITLNESLAQIDQIVFETIKDALAIAVEDKATITFPIIEDSESTRDPDLLEIGIPFGNDLEPPLWRVSLKETVHYMIRSFVDHPASDLPISTEIQDGSFFRGENAVAAKAIADHFRSLSDYIEKYLPKEVPGEPT